MTHMRYQESDWKSDLQKLAERFGLADIYVFGSRADDFTGEDHRASDPARDDADLDLGVRPRKDHHLGARERAELSVALEDVFEVPRVDLVVLPEAPPYLALAVVSGELLYCHDSTDQAEYELYVLRRAGDLAPFEHERRARTLGGS